jgi:hypothetical protein
MRFIYRIAPSSGKPPTKVDRSPDGAQRHPGLAAPHFAALNAGYELRLSSRIPRHSLFALPEFQGGARRVSTVPVAC